MNSTSMIRSCMDRMDNIVLRPSMTLSLSAYNRETGAFSEQKSISLSTGFTLLRGMLLVAGGSAALYGTMCFLRYNELRKIRRSLKKQSAKGKKMTNS